MSDDRRCATGYLCRGHTVEDGKRRPAQLATSIGMCEPCQRWIRSCVRQLPTDWCKLELTIGETRTGDAAGKTFRTKPGSRVPLNATTDELMRDIHQGMTIAAQLVAGAANARWRYEGRATARGSDYRTIQAAADLLAERIPDLIAAEGGIDAAKHITELHHRVTRHLGETIQRERQHLPCPSCGAQALVKEVQDRRGRESRDGCETPEVIRCLACHGGPNRDGTWTEAEYQWLSKMVLSERDEMELTKWLVAEARWERDFHAWIAAERHWVLGYVAGVLNIESDPGLASADGLIDRVRGTAVIA